jgi:hypothetical protein
MDRGIKLSERPPKRSFVERYWGETKKRGHALDGEEEVRAER